MAALDLTKPFSGDLRSLTQTIGIAIAFFGLVLVAIIAYAGWSANETATERERTLVENAINRRIARVLNDEKSVAWWDGLAQRGDRLMLHRQNDGIEWSRRLPAGEGEPIFVFG